MAQRSEELFSLLRELAELTVLDEGDPQSLTNFEAACNASEAIACHNAGVMRHLGLGCDADDNAARALMKKACKSSA